MYKDIKKGQTNSYPIVTIKRAYSSGWYIKIEKDPSTSGTIFITNEEIKALQFELNKILKHNCCNGECNHDDCCGKVEANCPIK